MIFFCITLSLSLYTVACFVKDLIIHKTNKETFFDHLPNNTMIPTLLLYVKWVLSKKGCVVKKFVIFGVNVLVISLGYSYVSVIFIKCYSYLQLAAVLLFIRKEIEICLKFCSGDSYLFVCTVFLLTDIDFVCFNGLHQLINC